MATFLKKSSSQGLLLLCLVLLASSVHPAPISGQSTIDGGRKSKMEIVGTNKDAVIHDDIKNGCVEGPAHDGTYCCTKDTLCWPDLYQCAINCPCKVRCNG